VGYNVGDTIQIVDGIFAGHKGVVEEIDIDADNVRVTVSMFNRETSIDLKLNEVEPEKD
jgi:transcriptional antiterminator NusG